MDVLATPEQEMLRASVRRFLEETAPVTPWVRERWRLGGGTTDAAWKGLVGLGLTGLLLPEAHGGAGLALADMGVVLEEMGRVLHPGPYFVSALAATRLLVATGDDRVLAEWGPALASGDLRASVGLHEAERGGDWRSPATSAARRAGSWRLDGRKLPVLDAGQVDRFLVTASTEPADELGVFAVDAGAEGVTLHPLDSVDASRPLFALELDAAPARRVGEGDAGAAVAAAVDAATAGLVADGVGAAARVLELAVEHARTRVQFDRPIGSFQAVQHLLVGMLRDVELSRAAAGAALAAAEGESAAERARAVSVAKAFASESLPAVAARAIQVFGGIGFTWEIDVHLYYKRLMSLQHLFGDTSEHLEQIARLAVDA